ncbi:MAG TPA: MOSC N-terminal beta barrel domain-containing protein [Longimicrobiales bacterium]
MSTGSAAVAAGARTDGGARLALSGIRIYPVKSAAGIEVSRWEVDRFGLRYDRRWMVVDRAGDCMTQREHPRMALIGVALADGVLELRAPGAAPLRLPTAPPRAAGSLDVRIWHDRVRATPVSDEADRWLSEVLGTPCRLVFRPDGAERCTRPPPAGAGVPIAFPDAYPFLLLSEESLDGLNARLAEPLPMNRFRPNLIVRGAAAAHAEDTWKRVRVGSIPMDVVKPCARCVITTTDQATGERGVEPLRTLATYRRKGSGVLFGQNLIHRDTGTLRVGDPIEVLAAG